MGQQKANETIAKLKETPIIKSVEKRNVNDPTRTITCHTDVRSNMETSSFKELYRKNHKTVLNTMDTLKKKKSMKLNMGIHFEIYREAIKADIGRWVKGETSRIEETINDFGDEITAEIKPANFH